VQRAAYVGEETTVQLASKEADVADQPLRSLEWVALDVAFNQFSRIAAISDTSASGRPQRCLVAVITVAAALSRLAISQAGIRSRV
jgi:hypothetical protein